MPLKKRNEPRYKPTSVEPVEVHIIGEESLNHIPDLFGVESTRRLKPAHREEIRKFLHRLSYQEDPRSD